MLMNPTENPAQGCQLSSDEGPIAIKFSQKVDKSTLTAHHVPQKEDKIAVET